MKQNFWNQNNRLLTLKEKYATIPDLNDLAKELGVTLERLRGQASYLKLIRTAPNPKRGSTSTPEIDADLIKMYLHLPLTTMADAIDRSVDFVKRRLKHLGLEQPDEVKQRNKQLTQFKPGNKPHKSAEALRIAKEREDKKKLRAQEKERQAAIRESEQLQAAKRKKRNRPQFKTQTVDLSGKIRVQLNAKTHIFCNPGSDIEAIRLKYSNTSPLQNYHGNRI